MMSVERMNASDYRKSTYEIDPVFIDRWSARSFQEKEIPKETLLGLFEAARWAPSANNNQPWRFIVASTPEDRERFHSFINPGNLAWCAKAPVLVAVLSKTITENGSSYRTHGFDAGAAWVSLALQATKSGLITHPMGGFDRNKARTELQVPEEYELQIVVAIGYQGEKSDLSEELQEREKPSDRRPLQDLLSEGTFGKAINL
jgi:nitroreductase